MKIKANHMRSFLLIFCSMVFAGTFRAKGDEKQVRQWMQGRPVKFLENRGQMVDMNGKPVPFVLFKAEAPGLDMYITEKGLTYVFIKHKEEHERGEDYLNAIPGLKNNESIEIEWSRVDMILKGASIKKENIMKEGMSGWVKNYYLSNCTDGIRDVHAYEKITIKNIYPGIDWVLYNSDSEGFKYDFVVHPGADPDQIKLIYNSEKPLKLKRDGSIEIKTSLGVITENAPYSYLQSSKREIRSRFNSKILGEHSVEITFQLQDIIPIHNVDNEQLTALIIDPQLVWATFYGGNGLDGPVSIDCDPSGNVLVVVYDASSNLPGVDPGGGAYFQGTSVGGYDALILKFNNVGVLIWATYYGGASAEYPKSICTDLFGNVFITGYIQNAGFNVYNPGGGVYFQGALGGADDIFILKFNNAGARMWATYYGGSAYDIGNSICTDIFGNVFITGYTSSTNFPVFNAPGPTDYYQGTLGGGAFDSDVIILKFNNAGVRLDATYYGGTSAEYGNAICADISGNIFLTGYTNDPNFPKLNPGGGTYFQAAFGGAFDAFILKFDNAVVRKWASYYGGTSSDLGYSIATDPSGNVFVNGKTFSVDLPVLNPLGGTYFQGTNAGAGDAFILKFNNAGIRQWATYYGGAANEHSYNTTYDGVAIDPCGNVYISFNTVSTDVPTQNQSCGSAFYKSNLGGARDIFIIKFTNTGVRLWATYFGGDGDDFREPLATDKLSNLFVAGEWTSESGALTNVSYPLTDLGSGAFYDATFNGSGYDDDGFVAKFIPPVLTLTSTVTEATCVCNGSATITPAGGCSPYKYSWYNNAWSQIGNTQAINSLCSGNYQVLVNDTVNCVNDTDFVNVPSGVGLALNGTQTDLLCNGVTNGTASITISNGSGPYTYAWSNGQATQTATGLAAGSYTITVSDANSCSSTAVFVITSPLPLIGEFTKGTAICNGCGCKQWIMIGATGGISPYTYSWPDGYINRYKNNLCPGSYSVNISDTNGCSININLSTP